MPLAPRNSVNHSHAAAWKPCTIPYHGTTISATGKVSTNIEEAGQLRGATSARAADDAIVRLLPCDPTIGSILGKLTYLTALPQVFDDTRRRSSKRPHSQPRAYS